MSGYIDTAGEQQARASPHRGIRLVVSHLAGSALARRLAHGAFWSLISTVATRGLTLLGSVIVARLLGAHHFGEFGVIQTTVLMFATFAGFGLGLTATKYTAQYRVRDPLRVGHVLALTALVAWATAGLAALTLAGMARRLAAEDLAAPHLAPLLRLSAVLLFFTTLNGTQAGALAGFEAFRQLARVNLIAGVLTIPGLFVGTRAFGVGGAIGGLIVGAVIAWGLAHLALRREAQRAGVPFRLSGSIREWPILFTFSLPAALAATMVGPVNWLCAAWLVRSPDGYIQMGLYNAANQWRLAILFLPTVLSSAVLPVLSSLHSASDYQRYWRTLLLALVVSATVGLLLATGVTVFSSAIIAIYGVSFTRGTTLLVLLAFSAVPVCVSTIIGMVMISMGRIWLTLGTNLAWAALQLPMARWLIAAHGGAGLCLAVLLAYSAHMCLLCLWLELQRRRFHRVECHECSAGSA